jgi:molecular chaperone DnaK (HSP70)
VVALDFGTTYSGFAFWRKDNPSEITPGKWKTNATEVLESLKTPTSLLLNKDNELIEFGFEAERVFKELAEDEFDSDYRFFSKFKMKLHRKKVRI